MPPQPFASLQMPCGLATLFRSKRMVAGMSVSRNRLNGTGIRLSAAIAADYCALMKPRVMALAVFTAFVGLVIAPGVINPLRSPLLPLAAIALGAGAAGVLNMWYDMDIDAVMSRTSRRPIPTGRSRRSMRWISGCSCDYFGDDAGHDRRLARRLAARLHDLLLRRRLHNVAEALDAAEHRDRRCRRRAAAGHWLGCGDQRGRHRKPDALPDHLPVDAAALLGARPVQGRRLRHRPASR